MENYNLQSDESVLYRGNVQVADKKGKGIEGLTSSTNTELLLTNLRLILLHRSKRFLGKEQVEAEAYPISEIKIYNGVPQVKQKDTCVEIYFISGERAVLFNVKAEARKFVSAVYELITGKSMAERGADKVRGAVDTVDNALGLDTVEAVKGVLKDGLFGVAFGKDGKIPGKVPEVVARAESAVKQLMESGQPAKTPRQGKETAAENIDSQIETLQKLKGLLDSGVISQEEFEAKKRQILGLQ